VGALEFFVRTVLAAGRDCQKRNKNERLIGIADDCFHGFALAFDFASLAMD
jgi:hypothetical protein